jgi:LuxR family maltose regulon positive regulatory protein
VHLEARELSAAQADLGHADRFWPPESSPELAVLRAAAEVYDPRAGDGSVQPRLTVDEIDALPLDDPGLEALARLTTGAAQLIHSGDLRLARDQLEAALRTADVRGFTHLAMQCAALLSVLADVQGDYRRMRACSEQAVASAMAHGWQESPWFVVARTAQAYASLLRAEPAQAESQAGEAIAALGVNPDPRLQYTIQIVRGAAMFDGGRHVTGLQEMQRARVHFGDLSLNAGQAAMAAVLEHRAALLLGHAAAARTALGWLVDRLGVQGESVLMRSWEAASAGRDAKKVLRPLLDGSVPTVLPQTPVEGLLLEAALALSSSDRHRARRALHAALITAEPLDALRPFALAGQTVRELLVHQVGSFGATEKFAARALATCSPIDHDLVERVLSDRELTVLMLLPSLLSLDEIAADLTVSVNTIKSHVRSIYAKLGVRSRRTAVAAAHERGLLTMSAQ